NVRWHDGQPFTAADVIFTYETMINPKTPTAYGGDFKAVESVEAVDQYTVHVRYKHPSAKALQSWSVWMLPKHLLETAAGEGKLTALQFKRQTEYPAFRKAYVKYQYAANVYVYLGMNLRDPRFADRRVRQAFAHAINKREIIDGVRLGLAREATGPYKPGTWQYNPNVHQYPYDPAKAASLLAEAGWEEKNSDGILHKNRPLAKFHPPSRQ